MSPRWHAPAILSATIILSVLSAGATAFCLAPCRPVAGLRSGAISHLGWEGKIPRAARRTGNSMSVAETEVVWSKYWEDQVAAHAAKHVDNEGIFFITDADEAMEKAIVALEEINPTEKPGEWDDDAKAAKISGRWEAMYAPHMAKLSSPFGVRFGPVRYTMGSDGDKRTITSNVQYRSKLFGSGWLNAAGTYCSLDPSTVRIDFENFWWDPTERATPSDAPAPDAGGLVQTLGTAGFLPSFSRFPVRYVSDDLCIFEFKLTGTNIVAVKKP